MQFISQFMNTDVPGWVLAIIISTGARWQFCKNDSDKKSLRLVLTLYFIAWIAVIATAPIGGTPHDIAAPIAMLMATVESAYMVIRNDNVTSTTGRLLTFVLLATPSSCYYFIYVAGGKDAAVICEYTTLLMHVFTDTLIVFFGYPFPMPWLSDDMEITQEAEDLEIIQDIDTGSEEAPVTRLDLAVIAPLGVMYLTGMVRFYLKEKDALATWQIPSVPTLLAGAHTPTLEMGTWSLAAVMSLLARVTAPSMERARTELLSWAVPFVSAWVVLLWKSQQLERGDTEFLVSCAALVGVAVKLSTIGPGLAVDPAAALIAACTCTWFTVKVLAESVAPEAWLTSAVWPLGQHCLMIGLLLLNSASSSKVCRNGRRPLSEGHEMAEVILC